MQSIDFNTVAAPASEWELAYQTKYRFPDSRSPEHANLQGLVQPFRQEVR